MRCRKILFRAARRSKCRRKASTSNWSRIVSICASVGRSSGTLAITIDRHLCSNSSESATAAKLQLDRYSASTEVQHRERSGGVHENDLAARCDLNYRTLVATWPTRWS